MEVPQYFSTRVKGQWRIYTFREWAEGGGGKGGAVIQTIQTLR